MVEGKRGKRVKESSERRLLLKQPDVPSVGTSCQEHSISNLCRFVCHPIRHVPCWRPSLERGHSNGHSIICPDPFAPDTISCSPTHSPFTQPPPVNSACPFDCSPPPLRSFLPFLLPILRCSYIADVSPLLPTCSGISQPSHANSTHSRNVAKSPKSPRPVITCHLHTQPRHLGISSAKNLTAFPYLQGVSQHTTNA